MQKKGIKLPAQLIARLFPAKPEETRPDAGPKGPPCPECRKRVASLSAHMLRDHEWRTLDGVVTQPGARSDRMALCPDCGVPVRVRNLATHRELHTGARRKRPNARNVRAPIRKDQSAPPGAKSATTAAIKTLKRKKARIAPAARTVSDHRKRVYTWDQDRWGSFEEERRERRADATRGLGYARRESGHWGSTVAYDDYGDESHA